MRNLRRRGLQTMLASALLALPVATGLPHLPKAHASCGGNQYISEYITKGASVDIYLVRDACNGAFAYSDNAPAGSNTTIFGIDNTGTVKESQVSPTGQGVVQSSTVPILCGYHYVARIITPVETGLAPNNDFSGHTFC